VYSTQDWCVDDISGFVFLNIFIDLITANFLFLKRVTDMQISGIAAIARPDEFFIGEEHGAPLCRYTRLGSIHS